MKIKAEKILKPIVAVILVSSLLSSCVVRERTVRRAPPPRTERVIIRP